MLVFYKLKIGQDNPRPSSFKQAPNLLQNHTCSTVVDILLFNNVTLYRLLVHPSLSRQTQEII